MIEWHPIETHPTEDGAEVLLGCWKAIGGVGTWLWVDNDMWSADAGRWRFPDNKARALYPPTHWAEIGEP